MSVYENQNCISIPASADLSSNQYLFNTVNSSGQLATTGDGAAADGVLQNKPAAAGRAGALAISGRVKVKAGGTVAAGAQVASDSAGKCVLATTGDEILGRAISAGATNEIMSIIFQPRSVSIV